MKTTIFIKLTGMLAIGAYVMLAFTSCQQAGRKYEKESYQSFQKTNTIQTKPA